MPEQEIKYEKKIPQGVVAILTDKNGKQISNASDFYTGFPAGFTQREMQETRARSALAMNTVRALSSPFLSDAIRQYDADQIMQNMCRNGCGIIIVTIGYDD